MRAFSRYLSGHRDSHGERLPDRGKLATGRSRNRMLQAGIRLSETALTLCDYTEINAEVMRLEVIYLLACTVREAVANPDESAHLPEGVTSSGMTCELGDWYTAPSAALAVCSGYSWRFQRSSRRGEGTAVWLVPRTFCQRECQQPEKLRN